MGHLSARELREKTVEGRLLLVTPKDMIRPLREGINFFIQASFCK
jgi:hypothetical protein